MTSIAEALHSAIESVLRERTLSTARSAPGQWQVPLKRAWSTGFTVSIGGKGSTLRAKVVFLVFAEEVQRLMDRVLSRQYSPERATLTIAPEWAREFLSASSRTNCGDECHSLDSKNLEEVAVRLVHDFQTVGMPTAERLSTLDALIELQNAGRLGEVCLPVDYVASCALLLAGRRREAESFVAARLAELSRVTSDSALEPFLSFGPALVALRDDA